jgi:hypothetical protein
MPAHDRLELARDSYLAYQSGDRGVIEELLTDDFTFYSPADVGIDRAMYFERCWPNAEQISAFDFKRLVESGDEVIVTYESTKTNGVVIFGLVKQTVLRAAAARRAANALASDRATLPQPVRGAMRGHLRCAT